MVRKRFTFRGTVQGVGFRPAVYRLAASLGLSGFVQNRRSVVAAEVQGEEEAVLLFASRVAGSMPPAARIEAMSQAAIPHLEAETGFRIVESAVDSYSFPPIPPDLPLCADCAKEMLAPGNRRYLYPFITCTQCGPRFSIVERTPFDRDNTTMRPFLQCPACAAEYADPDDRRFHSQANSCGACGPSLECRDPSGSRIPGDPVRAAIAALQQGKVVAILGIGGFHLAADPRSEKSLHRLRKEKERERKPFALMVRDLTEARALCVLSEREEGILASAEAPILIAPRRASAPPWTDGVSDTGTLGLMLPTTPLHLLLFSHPGLDIGWRSLIMTSGNRAGEPIVTDPAEALVKLSGSADLFLSHDRKIAFRTDDSILRTGASSPPYLMRRSRGYVPRLIPLSREVRGAVLALGGDLKNAPALALGRDLHLCAFNGDLESPETLSQFNSQVDQVLGLYGVSPDAVMHDLHPHYFSSRWNEHPAARRIRVQHHHAHALSVMAEHGLEEALALCFDGTGYGTDGGIWGGEFLHATRSGFARLGSFSPFPLPGGDEAILHPPRIAYSLLGDRAAGRIPGLPANEEDFLRAMLSAGLNCPAATSLGRIFDAAAAILGLVRETSYEGEGPIRLEGKGMDAWNPADSFPAGHAGEDLVPFAAGPGDERLFLADPRPLLAALMSGSQAAGGKSRVPELSLLFHREIARASAEGARKMRQHAGVSRLVLSGGVFQNLLFRELLLPLLIKDGFEVFLNVLAPPGDGGLAVGQAWYQES
jgi:hydrogenase maturation protein HypF